MAAITFRSMRCRGDQVIHVENGPHGEHFHEPITGDRAEVRIKEAGQLIALFLHAGHRRSEGSGLKMAAQFAHDGKTAGDLLVGSQTLDVHLVKDTRTDLKSKRFQKPVISRPSVAAAPSRSHCCAWPRKTVLRAFGVEYPEKLQEGGNSGCERRQQTHCGGELLPLGEKQKE